MNDPNKARIRPLIESLHATGGTDIKNALKHSLTLLQQRQHLNSVAAVALLSDGQDGNRTSPNTDTLRTLTSLATVSAIGIGANHDAQYLGETALLGRGTFAFAQTPEQIAGAMGAVVGNLLRVVAADVKLQIATVAPSSGGTLVNTATSENVGLVFAGETKRYLFTTSVPSFPASPAAPFLRATLTYRLPGASAEHSTHLDAAYAPDHVPTPEVLVLLEETRNRTHVVAAIETATAYASDENFSDARRVLEEAKARLLAALYPTSDHTQALLFDLDGALTSCQNTRAYSQGGSAQMQCAYTSHVTQKGSGCNDYSDKLYLSASASRSKSVMLGKAARSKAHY
jgi:hypothetical protein